MFFRIHGLIVVILSLISVLEAFLHVELIIRLGMSLINSDSRIRLSCGNAQHLDYVHMVTFPSVSKMSFLILSVDALSSRKRFHAACECLSQQKFDLSRLLITVYFPPDGVVTCHIEFRKMSSAHYNKVNSCMYVCAASPIRSNFFSLLKKQNTYKSFINHYTVERLRILFYFLLRFLT